MRSCQKTEGIVQGKSITSSIQSYFEASHMTFATMTPLLHLEVDFQQWQDPRWLLPESCVLDPLL